VRRLLLALLLVGCSSPARVERQVRGLLDQQVRQWNAGDLEGFMQTYWRSEQTRFQSGGEVSLGWQPLLERYRQRYADRAAMGKLDFPELRVVVLAPDAALAYGRWGLQRAHDTPGGVFTLLLRRTAEGWRIVYDHTSAATRP
jgi:ketosteroid isomerase-like protein